MEKEIKCKSIDYTVTLEYGKPDAYNRYSRNYEWEIGIRLDQIWKHFPDFESFLDQIIFYQKAKMGYHSLIYPKRIINELVS